LQYNHITDVMVNALVSSAVDRGVRASLRSNQRLLLLLFAASLLSTYH